MNQNNKKDNTNFYEEKYNFLKNENLILNKNDSPLKITKAYVVSQTNTKIFFRFNNKFGYLLKSTLFNITKNTLETIFKKNSYHYCVVCKFDHNLNMYKLDYVSIHPEIWPIGFVKIVPTKSHCRNLTRFLNAKLKEFENEENSNNSF